MVTCGYVECCRTYNTTHGPSLCGRSHAEVHPSSAFPMGRDHCMMLLLILFQAEYSPLGHKRTSALSRMCLHHLVPCQPDQSALYNYHFIPPGFAHNLHFRSASQSNSPLIKNKQTVSIHFVSLAIGTLSFCFLLQSAYLPFLGYLYVFLFIPHFYPLHSSPILVTLGRQSFGLFPT